MSRARPRSAIEQCPECRTWWRVLLWEDLGEWLMWCPVCGVVRWRAVLDLTDLAKLTAAQQAAYWKSPESTDD